MLDGNEEAGAHQVQCALSTLRTDPRARLQTAKGLGADIIKQQLKMHMKHYEILVWEVPICICISLELLRQLCQYFRWTGFFLVNTALCTRKLNQFLEIECCICILTTFQRRCLSRFMLKWTCLRAQPGTARTAREIPACSSLQGSIQSRESNGVVQIKHIGQPRAALSNH